jgi:hypothetical protein
MMRNTKEGTNFINRFKIIPGKLENFVGNYANP